MQIIEDIIKNILAIARGFKGYEFIHTYFGPSRLLREAKKISPRQAYDYLLGVGGKLKDIPDEFPYFRRTYYKDFINSVIAQADFFVFGRNCDMPPKNAVESFFAVKLPRLFSLGGIRRMLYRELKSAGFSSVRQFKVGAIHPSTSSGQVESPLRFKNFAAFKKFVKEEIKNSFFKLKKSPLKNIDIDLKRALSKFNLTVESPHKGMPHCYFYYKGNYGGVMGLKFRREAAAHYVKGLISHEISPGHNFYYLVKEELFRSKKIDAGITLDNFYSPETIINEGLAMSVDILFKNILEKEVKIKGLVEKYLHKVLYNIWYSKFILKKDGKKYIDALYNDLDMPRDRVEFWLDFYLGDEWKYYSVSYAIGSCYVDKFLNKYGAAAAKYLYNQQSVNTMRKIEKTLVGAGLPRPYN